MFREGIHTSPRLLSNKTPVWNNECNPNFSGLFFYSLFHLFHPAVHIVCRVWCYAMVKKSLLLAARNGAIIVYQQWRSHATHLRHSYLCFVMVVIFHTKFIGFFSCFSWFEELLSLTILRGISLLRLHMHDIYSKDFVRLLCRWFHPIAMYQLKAHAYNWRSFLNLELS